MADNVVAGSQNMKGAWKDQQVHRDLELNPGLLLRLVHWLLCC